MSVDSLKNLESSGNTPALPKGWDRKTIGELADVGTGTTPRSGDPRFYEKGTIPWVTSTAVNQPTIHAGTHLVTKAALEETRLRLYPKNTLLIALYGEGQTRGKVSELLIEATINQALAALVLKPSVAECRSFIKYYLHQHYLELRRNSAGGVQPNLNLSIIRKIAIPLAPVSEQRRIVAKIEELLSDLDAGVAALERVRANLKRYRAAVLNAAVTGKLTAEWRRQNAGAESSEKLLACILQERQKNWEIGQFKKHTDTKRTPSANWRKGYAQPKAVPPNEMKLLPSGWVWASVDQLADVGTGTTPSRGNSSYYSVDGIPWVTSSAVNSLNVTKGTECVTEKAMYETSLHIYPKNTLIIALYGEGQTRGKVSELLIPATINQALAALVFEGVAEQCRRFVKLFLLSNYQRLRRQSAGGVQPNLNLGLVRQICFGLPPIQEQYQISAEVERRVSVIDAAQVEVEHSLKRAARLRQSILKRAFEGKLVPQDPADKPLSLRLESDAAKPEGVSHPVKGRKRNSSVSTSTHA